MYLFYLKFIAGNSLTLGNMHGNDIVTGGNPW